MVYFSTSDTLMWALQKCQIALYKFQIENWNSDWLFLLETPKSIL